MSFRFYSLIFCYWLALTSASHAGFSELQFERLLTGEESHPINNGALRDILQDGDGFLWFVGEGGAVRYDGTNFRHFQRDASQPHAVSSNFVWDAALDHSSVLWFATSNGLNRYDRTSESFTTVPGLDGAMITALAVDQQNRLWVATSRGLSLLEVDRKQLSTFSPATEAPAGDASALTTSNLINSVFVDSSNRVWTGNKTGELRLFDLEKGQFKPWRDQDANLDGHIIEDILEDAKGYIWVATLGGGLYRITPQTQALKHFVHDPTRPSSLGGNNVRSLYKDRAGRLWIGTEHAGLELYSPDTESFQHFRHRSQDLHSLSSDNVRAIFEDTAGDLWVGNFPKGINHHNSSTRAFTNIRQQADNPNSLINGGIVCFLRSKDGLLWIGTERGLSVYDEKNDRFTNYTKQEKPYSLRANAITALEEDVNGDIWVGTWSGGLHRFERASERFHHYGPNPANPGSLNSQFVWRILRDRSNTLWIATETGGLNRYNRENDNFTHFTHRNNDPSSISTDFVWSLLEDKQGNFWVGTLDGLDRFDRQSGKFIHYRHDPDNPKSISNNRINSMRQGQDGSLWIATEEGGVNRLNLSTGEFEAYTQSQGLASNQTSSLVEDGYGTIWVAGNAGLTAIHPRQKKLITYNRSNGLVSDLFNRDASLLGPDGRLYFGSSEGISVFNPAELTPLSTPPKVVFTDFELPNSRAKDANHGAKLHAALTDGNPLQLEFGDNMFSIHYAALSFRSPQRNQYKYTLEGFDQQWHEVGNQTSATYTNLDPGHYVFRVKAANSEGLWNDTGISLPIIIDPSPWRSPIAYGLYTLWTAIFCAALVQALIKRIELAKAKTLNQQLRKLDKIKDSFLATTSHELRTPLNGMIGIAESLQNDLAGPLPVAAYPYLATIANSGRRLAALINDILDYSKLAANSLELDIQPQDLHQLAEEALSLLQPLAEQKNLQLINKISENRTYVMADANRLQQILLNLVGNSIKYSKQGVITVSCGPRVGSLAIMVEDQGLGIPKKDLLHIFEAFHQLDSEIGRRVEGTGLGLAITRQLVQLHGGDIVAESNLDEGSRFIFTLPLASHAQWAKYQLQQEKHGKTHPLVDNYPQRLAQTAAIAEDAEVLAPTDPQSFNILIVDDDSVNRMVLRSILGLAHYSVQEASGGREAIDLLARNPTINLIILDVMMPNMSGFEACRTIRRTHPQLPIIFLSAKTLAETRAEGMAAGGNEFLTKPVVKVDLLQKVEKFRRTI